MQVLPFPWPAIAIGTSKVFLYALYDRTRARVSPQRALRLFDECPPGSDRHHYELLAHAVLPELRRHRRGSRRLRLWSAGCATGEEPYSMAMVLAETLVRGEAWDARILATDLDSEVLAVAERGTYPEERLSGVSPERRRRHFQKGRGPHAGLARFRPGPASPPASAIRSSGWAA